MTDFEDGDVNSGSVICNAIPMFPDDVLPISKNIISDAGSPSKGNKSKRKATACSKKKRSSPNEKKKKKQTIEAKHPPNPVFAEAVIKKGCPCVFSLLLIC